MTDAEKFDKIMGGMCKYLRRKNVIFAYNKEYVSDTLLAITADDKGLEQTVERKGNVAQIKMKKARSLAGTFAISEVMTIEGRGQVTLTKEQIQQLNTMIKEAGFSEELPADTEPKSSLAM